MWQMEPESKRRWWEGTVCFDQGKECRTIRGLHWLMRLWTLVAEPPVYAPTSDADLNARVRERLYLAARAVTAERKLKDAEDRLEELHAHDQKRRHAKNMKDRAGRGALASEQARITRSA